MSIPLARLTTANLDPEMLSALFNDLSTLVEVDHVLIKGEATAHAGVIGLAAAQRALASGGRGIQIRYHWAGEGWLDTIMNGPDGIRLVRSPMPSFPSQESS